MLLTNATEIPVGKNWLYETKYDGFRCILEWENEPILKSRNGKILNQMFPEIINFCHEIQERISPYLPLTLDGELVYLTNNFQSEFSRSSTKRSNEKSRGYCSSMLKSFLAIISCLIF